jgi:phosphoribosylamine--glycine ligase
MGVYSPVPIVTDDEYAQMERAMQAACDGLVADGIDYRGVLYGGFMLTPEGPQVLEFNARFGDPETQVILPRLKTDLVEVMLAVAEDRLDQVELAWRDEWAVSVVLASKGYPMAYEKGFAIEGIDAARALPGVTVYHAGTALDADGTVRTAGGRVLNVTALGATFEEARERAYAGCEAISFEGKTLRTDIGRRALLGRDAWEA